MSFETCDKSDKKLLLTPMTPRVTTKKEIPLWQKRAGGISWEYEQTTELIRSAWMEAVLAVVIVCE